MKIVFADTYYFLAAGSESDSGHARSVQFAAEFTGQIMTTEWVLTELGDALASPVRRQRFLNLLGLIQADKTCVVIPSSHELFNQGIVLFAQRQDKEWSLTDCISFVVMQQHGITEALTADHHFEQAGFIPLLK